MDLHQAEPVEPSVDGSKRTEILAERPEKLHGQEDKEEEDSKLPEE